jgi:hypothetical protein
VLNKKCDLAINTIAEDNFQNQAYLNYIAFNSYLSEATTFNSATNTMADKTFGIIYNPVYPDFITCNSYFDGPMALITTIDGIIASTNFDIILSQVCPCNSYFNKLITLNNEASNEVFFKYIACDFNSDKLSTFNEVFLKYIACDSDSDKLLTLNLATSTIVNNTFNI